MDYKITDEMKKLLTEEVLGGMLTPCCILEKCPKSNPYNECITKIGICESLEQKPSRTFTTDTDMLDVFRAIRDKGKWATFFWFGRKYCSDRGLSSYTDWLFLDNSERACVLAAMWWKEDKSELGNS